MKIAVFVGSNREGRTSTSVAQWAVEQFEARNDGHVYEIVDLVEQDLSPITDLPPRMVENGAYADPKTVAWAQVIGAYDAYVFVSPEYNASVPGPMKHAFDLLFAEWTGKPVSFISFGSSGGSDAVRHWRDITERVGMINVAADAQFAFADYFPDFAFHPDAAAEAQVQAIADELIDAADRAAIQVEA